MPQKPKSHTDLTRRELLGGAGALALSGIASGANAGGLGTSPATALKPAGKSKQPNVLFIISDDLNMHLNCYGHSSVHSPNIDRLASMGLRFDRAYCQYPVCGPSRSSFLTGLRPDTVQVVDGETYFRDKCPNVVSLPQHFKLNGYFTARVIKVFHDARSTPDDPKAWDVAIEPYRTKLGSEGRRQNYTPNIKGLALPPSVEAEGGDEDQVDGLGAVQAIHLLENRPDKPFFLAVGFRMPHIPWIAPKRYFDMYDPARVELPEVRQDAWDHIPRAAIGISTFNYGMDDKTRREALCAYYATVSFMDAQVGKLLDALKRLHILDNTIIVFLSDNGWHVGEHGMWHKFTLFEESARVPLIVCAPGMKSKGKACEGLVEFVDIFPTLTDLCGLKPPDGLEGISMRPLLENPARPWKTAAFTQQARNPIMGRSIRTERWRYTEWDEGRDGVELYDEQADPHEFANLANDPEYAGRMGELQGMLRAGWRSALPKK